MLTKNLEEESLQGHYVKLKGGNLYKNFSKCTEILQAWLPQRV